MSSPVVTSPVVLAVGAAIEAVMIGNLAEVAVLDGIDPEQAYSPRSITVGGTWDPETETLANQAADTTIEESGAGRQETETTLVYCVAYSGSGDLDFTAHRARVGAQLAAVRSAVRAITSIDGRASRATIAEQSWVQGVDNHGALAMAPFTVRVVRLL